MTDLVLTVSRFRSGKGMPLFPEVNRGSAWTTDKERSMRSQTKTSAWQTMSWALVCLVSLGLVFSVVASV